MKIHILKQPPKKSVEVNHVQYVILSLKIRAVDLTKTIRKHHTPALQVVSVRFYGNTVQQKNIFVDIDPFIRLVQEKEGDEF